MSTPEEGRLASDIAELALSLNSRAEFRTELLRLLARAVGYDVATMASSTDGSHVQCAAFEVDAQMLASRGPDYMNEFTAEELRRALAADRSLFLDDVIPAERRARLSFYREVYEPQNIRAGLVGMWAQAGEHGGFQMGRAGRGARFAPSDLALLDRLTPILRVADRALAAPGTKASDAECCREFTRELKVTETEHRIVSLVERGLTNPEIGGLLGLSRNTVRNHVASAFKKLHVSTRAELVYMLRTEPAQGLPRRSHAGRREMSAWMRRFRPTVAP